MMKSEVVVEANNTKEVVEQILEEDDHARNNDTYLVLLVWKKTSPLYTFAPIHAAKHSTVHLVSPETIIRSRRVIQNKEGRLLPTDYEVAVKRKIKEEILRENYGRR